MKIIRFTASNVLRIKAIEIEQVWVERVEDDSEAAVLIEDGSVVQR